MRIAIANDVQLVVEGLRQIITAQKSYQLAWVAYDGAEAFEKCQKDTPDLLLLDLVMPIMNGVEAAKLIMQHCPCPILIVTSTVAGHSTLVFEAMGAGALDVVKTPELSGSGIREFLKKIQSISYLYTKHRENISEIDLNQANRKEKSTSQNASALPGLLVIGASTGGPMAVANVLSHLPLDTSLAIVLVQHVDAFFAEGLAAWLNDQTRFPVCVAKEGEVPAKGKVLIAGKDEHLIMGKDRCLHYTKEMANKAFVPSVDVFFHSVALNWPNRGIGVLLTGMGTDGAAGLKELRKTNWFTIAEHQSSCIVYGMPKAAIEVGAAVEIVPLEKIGQTIALTEKNLR